MQDVVGLGERVRCDGVNARLKHDNLDGGDAEFLHYAERVGCKLQVPRGLGNGRPAKLPVHDLCRAVRIKYDDVRRSVCEDFSVFPLDFEADFVEDLHALAALGNQAVNEREAFADERFLLGREPGEVARGDALVQHGPLVGFGRPDFGEPFLHPSGARTFLELLQAGR